jgi:hypothetical protein
MHTKHPPSSPCPEDNSPRHYLLVGVDAAQHGMQACTQQLAYASAPTLTAVLQTTKAPGGQAGHAGAAACTGTRADRSCRTAVLRCRRKLAYVCLSSPWALHRQGHNIVGMCCLCLRVKGAQQHLRTARQSSQRCVMPARLGRTNPTPASAAWAAMCDTQPQSEGSTHPWHAGCTAGLVPRLPAASSSVPAGDQQARCCCDPADWTASAHTSEPTANTHGYPTAQCCGYLKTPLRNDG